MTTQETTVKGSPTSLYAVAAYLRDTFGAQATILADEVYAGRTNTWEAWQCGAADELYTRLGSVGAGVDVLAGEAQAAARAVETLADALVSARGYLARARQVATDAGLRLTGNTIHHPGDAPSEGGGADHAAKITAWNTAVASAGDGYQVWYDAVNAFGSAREQSNLNLTTAATSVFEAAARGISVYNQAIRMMSAFNINYEAALNHIDVDLQEMNRIVKDGRLSSTVTHERFYKVDQYIRDGKKVLNPDLRKQLLRDIKNVKPGAAVSRTFAALGVVTTAFGIYQDLKDGESSTQAVVSNVVPAAAGAGATMLTSMAVGATLGSAFPVAGTVVGAALGAVVGGAVCVFSSGMIDHVFENGLKDVKGTLNAGRDAVVDTGKAIGRVAGEAGKAISNTAGKAVSTAGEGLKNAWNSIF